MMAEAKPFEGTLVLGAFRKELAHLDAHDEVSSITHI